VSDALDLKADADENLIVIPNALYAVESNQCWLGFDNLISADYKDYWWDIGGAGQQFDESWVYTPTAASTNFSLMLVRGLRSNNSILSSNSIPVKVASLSMGASGVESTNAVTALTNTPIRAGALTSTITGWGELRNFTSDFNAMNIPILVGNAGGSTNAISRVDVEVRNIVYTAGDMGNQTNVRTGALVATGTVAVSSVSMTNLNVFVRLDKTVKATNITGNCMFVGYRTFDSASNNTACYRVSGQANDYISTNHHSHYFWTSPKNWTFESGDVRVGIELKKTYIYPTNKVLAVGDSTTAGSQWVGRMVALSTNEAELMKIETIGTKTNSSYPGVSHEGVSGKTWKWFTSDTGSPFVVSGSLNMSNYFANVITNTPDYILVHLGINDTYLADDALTDAGIQAQWNLDYPRITNFVSQVLAYNSSAKIGLMMTIPPAYEQFAFGDDYASGKTRYRQKRNQLLYAKYIQDSFTTYNADSVFVIPIYTALDTLHNFPTASYAPNVHNTNTIVRQSNALHPSMAGYNQIGDAAWAWLKNKVGSND